jgi:FkbM family methyltransferase
MGMPAGTPENLDWPTSARDIRFRVEMTVACRDCEAIPKHPDAGTISTRDGIRVQTMHNGIRVIAGGYGGKWTEEIIARLRGHHEPQEELVFQHILRRLPAKATMLELGGNWSYYSLWFLEGAPGERRSIVVEPDPNNLETGRRNARLNGREIEFLQASVGEVSASARPFATETAGTLDLPQMTVPELFARFGLDRLDILHCDAQGAELHVIRSALELMQKGAIGFVVISTHSHHISGDPLTHQRCLALLEGAGAAIVAEHEVHESFSGDGLIVACFSHDEAMRSPVAVSRNRYSNALFRNPLFDLSDAFAERARLQAEIAALRGGVEGAGSAEARAGNAGPMDAARVADAARGEDTPSAEDIAQAEVAREANAAKALAAVNAAALQAAKPPTRLERLRSWRRFIKFETKRFLDRQRRSIEKRRRRAREPVAQPAGARAGPGQLTESAEAILWRLREVRRHSARDRAGGPAGDEIAS